MDQYKLIIYINNIINIFNNYLLKIIDNYKNQQLILYIAIKLKIINIIKIIN